MIHELGVQLAGVGIGDVLLATDCGEAVTVRGGNELLGDVALLAGETLGLTGEVG